ncbi:AsmA family protein [Pseudomonas cavernae]|uniref:AsmA family protein n=1 Tax=Pseudomonas cavernae TaxID=2320867 RepID=A0A385Z085_9PSED|nr:AsmA family protein [Pseudomonas cavernae]AYC31253.1 AsmA family protein [Pseudomonas cavernae]
MSVRRVLGRSLAVLLLLFAALAIGLSSFDWNRLKPILNDKVSVALDRPFAIHGNLAVVWRRTPELGGWHALLPWPLLVAEDLRLGNPPWAKGQQFVSLKRVELRLALLPLLWRQLSILHIQLSEPHAHFERLADGRNNWTFDRGKQTPDAEPSPWTLDIGVIGFDRGIIRVDDRGLQSELELRVDPLGKPIPFSQIVGAKAAERASAAGAAAQDYAFAWQVKGYYRGQALSGNGKVGGLLALQDASQPFPVQAKVQIGSTQIGLAGILRDPQNLGALDLRLQLSGRSLAQLYPLTGVTLPDTPAFATDGQLSAQLREAGGARFRYRQFNGTIGGSDIHGDLTYVAGQPRPKLSGTLSSNQLRFADLAPLIGADSPAEQQARGVVSQQPADKVLPVEQFRTERWRAMDADVSFSGKRIVHGEQLPLDDLFSHIVLADGQLRLQPLRFAMAGGKLEANLQFNGGVTPLQGKAQVQARNLRLKQLFPTFEAMRTSLGALHGDAELSGTGNSVAALLGSANGGAKLLINDGAISRDLMEIVGLNVGNYVVGQLFGDKPVRINCAAADLGWHNGVLNPRLAVFDTENAIVHIGGTANFKNEKLDLSIHPQSKGVRIISLRSPLYVRGTFKQPQAGVQALPLLARGAGLLALGAVVAPAAGLLALVAPSGGEAPNECTPLLQRLQAPAPAPRAPR